MNFVKKTVLVLLPCLSVFVSNHALANSDDVLFDKIIALQQKKSASVGSATVGLAEGLLAKAKTLIGTPYRFGGNTPSGFDCSGFMQYVFKNAGISLPRSSREMALVGSHVSREALQIGDMVFFAHSGKNISHVGMYVGDNKFIHSPSSGKTVEITSMDANYWKSRYITARRVL